MLERATHHIRLRGGAAVNSSGSDALPLEPLAADMRRADEHDGDEIRGAA